jgi:antitoxin component YwqK of YwqJK toxin-antitoxin module
MENNQLTLLNGANKRLLAVAVILLVSCTESTRTEDSKLVLTDYYANGSVQAVYETTKDTIMHGKAEVFFPDSTRNPADKEIKFRLHYVMGRQDGLMTEFYENGAKKVESMYKAGHVRGLFKEYYPSGNLKAEGNLYDDQPLGTHQYFMDTPEKRVLKSQDFVIVEMESLKKESLLNYSIIYDSTGNIVNESTKLDFEEDKDFIKIKVSNKRSQHVRAVVANYDKFFHPRNFLFPDTISSSDGFQILISRKFAHLDTLRGRVQCFDTSDPKEEVQTLWFQYPKSY